MRCPYSVPLKNKYDVMGNPVYRACGQCAICRRNKMMSLQSRANYEYKKHKYNAFITLTYDDNHLYYRDKPFGEGKNVGLPTFKKEHIQKFFDDLRHYVKRYNLSNCDKDFTYLYSSEFGSDSARPHFHAILFGVDFPLAKKLATKLWRFGFVDSRPVHSGSIRYVCKYISKGLNGKQADLMYFDKGVEKPFVKWSKGLGSGYYKENWSEIKKNGFIKDGNKKIFVPPYYKNKIMAYNNPLLFKQEIDKQFTWIEKHNLAKHLGFNNPDEMCVKLALNSIHNELKKNINSRSSVDLNELQGVY